SIYASELRISIHVRSDLRAAQPELPDAAFQFGGRELRILHWNSSKTGEASRMIANLLRDVVVQSPGKIERISRFCPVAEHHRNCGKDLHRDILTINLFHSARWFPYVVADFAKQPVADHHSRAARLIMIEPHKTAVAVFRVEVRPVARQNVGVQINLQSK